MKREEPSTCLVNTLIDEITWECGAVVDEFAVFERIVELCVRHGATVEPHVNKVRLTLHGLS